MHMFLKTDRACFYCLLGLEIIGCSPIKVYEFLHMLTRFYRTRRPILMLDFTRKMFFVSRLGIIYCYSRIFSLGTSWYQFYLHVD